MADSLDLDNIDAAMQARHEMLLQDDNDPVVMVERVYQLWRHWANFELYIINPIIETVTPPLVIPAETTGDGEKEFVYPIHDYGNKLITSKAEDMYASDMSMCKLYYTIEKMINLLVERLKQGNIDPETKVEVAFGGHLLPQRKAFEVIINLKYNVVVTNFDPATWGDQYLRNLKTISNKGYGYPDEAPRDVYRQHLRIDSPKLGGR